MTRFGNGPRSRHWTRAGRGRITRHESTGALAGQGASPGRVHRTPTGFSLGTVALVSALAGLLAVLIIACGPESGPSPTPSAGPNSGVRGIVLLGPTCADLSVDASPCLTPYAAQMAIVDSNGNFVTTVTSGPDGHFQVALPPGDYVIQPKSDPNGYPSGAAVPVSVVAGDFTDVEVDYDTGIR